MGQKVDPKSFRLGIIYSWKSKWFAKKNFRFLLKEDMEIRDFLQKKLKDAGISSLNISRSAKLVTIDIHSSRPGIIIGKGGAGVEELKKEIKKIVNKRDSKGDVKIAIVEVRNPFANAQIVADMVSEQLEKRVAFRRILKQTIDKVKEAKGVKGVRVALSGRLSAGSDMSRREWLSQGNLPLHTIRANIDFAKSTAYTTYGKTGVKVWIYKGEVFEDKISKKNKASMTNGKK